MKKFAVILAGCGVYDGSEIHEAVLSMYAIARQGAAYDLYAPDINQHHVLNHLTGSEMKETRNVLVESARIARGKIRPLQELDVRLYDAFLLPGGFGVAKNLCTFAFEGEHCTVHPEVARVVRESVSLRKPLGALCISPVILAKVLGEVKITIGQDQSTAGAVEKMGANHVNASHGEVIIDSKHKIFTTPCYMLDANIQQIGEGAENIVKAMLQAC